MDANIRRKLETAKLHIESALADQGWRFEEDQLVNFEDALGIMRTGNVMGRVKTHSGREVLRVAVERHEGAILVMDVDQIKVFSAIEGRLIEDEAARIAQEWRLASQKLSADKYRELITLVLGMLEDDYLEMRGKR